MKILGGWSEDPLWGSFYDWTVEHPHAGGALWAVGIQSDLRRLYDAADQLALLPPGTRVLDIPCGGGVALRGLKPGQGVDYVAADISQKMLDRTRSRAERNPAGIDIKAEPRPRDVAAERHHSDARSAASLSSTSARRLS